MAADDTYSTTFWKGGEEEDRGQGTFRQNLHAPCTLYFPAPEFSCNVYIKSRLNELAVAQERKACWSHVTDANVRNERADEKERELIESHKKDGEYKFSWKEKICGQEI